MYLGFHLSPLNFFCHFVTNLFLSPSLSAAPHHWPLFYYQNNSASPAEGLIAKNKKKIVINNLSGVAFSTTSPGQLQEGAGTKPPRSPWWDTNFSG